jgi:hypothetical protein
LHYCVTVTAHGDEDDNESLGDLAEVNERNLAWIGYLLTAGPVILAFFRILAVSRWDLPTALVVAKSLNVFSVFIALAHPLMVIVLAGGVLLFYLSDFAVDLPLGLLLATIVGLFMIVSQIPLLWAGITAISGVIGLVYQWKERALRRQFSSSEWRDFRYSNPSVFNLRKHSSLVGYLFGSIVASVFLAQGFWLPAEVVKGAFGSPITGYVLESGDHDLTVMDTASSKVRIIRQEQIESREICTESPPRTTFGRVTFTPVWVLITDGPQPRPMHTCSELLE